MAWPASTVTLHDQFFRANRIANTIKIDTDVLVAASLAGPVERNQLRILQKKLANVIISWDEAVLVPGIQAYARDQFADQTLNVSTEFTAMRDAADDLRAWIHTNYTVDVGTGADLSYTTAADGTQTALTFSTAQLAGFRTEAALFTATIS